MPPDRAPTVAPTTKRKALPLALTAVVAVAWLALWLGGSSPYASHLSHHQRLIAYDGWIAFALFVGGWTLMIIAMMLPTASTLLGAFARLVHRRPQRGWLMSLVAGGFILTWVMIGVFFRVANLAVQELVDSIAWLEANTGLLAAGTVAAAGLYQFTPLKFRCLTACRSARGFIYRYWRGERAAADAVRVGLAYGLSCVGCCWALMLVMFALGLASVVWMLAIGAFMAVEKNTVFGSRLRIPMGIALVVLGVALAFTELPPPHGHSH